MISQKNGLLFLAFAAMLTSSTQAALYQVNRSFMSGPTTATLTGTVDIPLGNYVIQNMAPNPFTSVNLTLTVNATPFNLINALTNDITGTGQFTINASPTTLIFSASGNGANPADLVFSDNFNPQSFNRYAIGSDGNPAFETAVTMAGSAFANVQFPVTFGVFVPEPSSITFFSLIMLWLGGRRR